MPKRIILLCVCIGLSLIGTVYCFARTPVFTCGSQFSIEQRINNDNVYAEGLVFANLVDDYFLITLDGLLSHNDKKYLISRTLKMKYKTYNTSAHLYKITSIKTTRDDTDNVDDEIANNLLFGKVTGEQIFFLRKLNNNVILFGNHAFPQYGCKRD